MSFHFHCTESVRDGVCRIAVDQINSAIAEIDGDLPRHEVVHQLRKRCKKIRGLIRLVRPAFEKTYTTENRVFRDLARTLSPIRDAKSIIGTYDDLMDHFQSQINRSSFGSIRRALTIRLNAIDDVEIDQLLSNARELFCESRQRVRQWQLSENSIRAIADGAAKTHRRARSRLDDVVDDPTTAALHGLRKRLKYHWFHARLVREVWPEMMCPYIDVLDELADDLGDDHDMAVLRETLLESPDDFGSRRDVDAFVGLLDRRRKQVQGHAIPIARRVLAESSKGWADRLSEYWKIWKSVNRDG